tara:strand:+ start:834 stop:1433 length:600 start_codon:yes stop_codon:yes gene_type:complete
MKKCYKCSKNKDLTEFGKDKSRGDGKKPLCKECVKIDSHQNYYIRTKEERSSHNSEQYQNNKDKIKQKSKIKYQNNKEVFKKISYNQRISEGYGVYMLFHKPTQHYYIGEGWLYSRKTIHLSSLIKGKNTFGNIQKTYNKYPNVDKWEFKVLKKWEHINKDEGLYFERLLIDKGIRNNPKKLLNKNISGVRKIQNDVDT